MNAARPNDGWTATRCVHLRDELVACAHDHRRGRRMAAAERLGRLLGETAELLAWLDQSPESALGDARRRAAGGLAASLAEVAEAQRQRDPLGLADRLEHEIAPLLTALASAL